MRVKSVLFLFGLGFSLAACTSANQQQSILGNYQYVAAQFESSQGFESEPLDELSTYCEAFWRVRDYDRALTCATVLDRRADTETFSYAGSTELPKMSAKLFLSSIYRDLGDHERTREHALIGLRYLEAADERITKENQGLGNFLLGEEFNWGDLFRPEFYHILSVSHSTTGDTATARSYLDRYIATFDDREFSSEYTAQRSKQIALMEMHLGLGEYEEALKAVDLDTASRGGFGTIVEAFNKINPLSYLLFGAANLGDLNELNRVPYTVMIGRSLLRTDALEEAAAAYDSLLSNPKLEQSPGMKQVALQDRAEIHMLRNEFEGAVPLLKQSIDLIESQRRSIGSEEYRIGFLGDKQGAYGMIISALIRLGRIEEAFEYVERAKARALIDVLAVRKSFGAGNERRRVCLQSWTGWNCNRCV